MIAIDVVENFEYYLELPNKYDVNEYEIMEEFCLTVSDQRKQDSLLRAIKGKGAFRRFKILKSKNNGIRIVMSVLNKLQ
jgi:hypothetical protein